MYNDPNIVELLRRNPYLFKKDELGQLAIDYRLTARVLNQEAVDLMHRAADEIERLREERDEAEPLLNELWERRTEATEMRAEIERLRKVFDWVLPQLFRRIYPEYDLGHPHMYVLITAIKQPDGGIPKDMWETIKPFLDAKP